MKTLELSQMEIINGGGSNRDLLACSAGAILWAAGALTAMTGFGLLLWGAGAVLVVNCYDSL